MKVLHLLYSNTFSGAENVVCQIIGMFQGDEGVDMCYVSPDGPIKDALKERGVCFFPLKEFTKAEVKRVIKEYQPDVVHAHDMRASYVASRAVGKIPLISHIHNNAFDSRGISVKSIAYLFAARKAKHIFWVSQSAKNGYAFQGAVMKKSSVLYNIINVVALKEKMALDTNTYDYDVLYLGRLSFEKNPQRLICVLAEVAKKLPNAKFGIVGSGALEEEVKTLAKELGVDKNIDFLGFQSNPLKMLAGARAMIMTSRYEGTPMCALEAMALGTPIVSTPTDGLKDLVKDGENGFLSDEDSVLAEKLCLLIENDELYQKLSKAQSEKASIINDIESYKKALREQYGF